MRSRSGDAPAGSREAAETVAQSARLSLRRVALGDAAFLRRLLNEPSWLENIGDRGVRTANDARRFVRETIWPMYRDYGFGLYAVETRIDRGPIGLCGIVRRESLPGPDLGFALLPEFWGRGLAFEATSAVLAHARDVLHLPPLLAVTIPGNVRSVRLLERLGFEYRRPIRLAADGEEVKLYVDARAAAPAAG